MSIYSTNEHVNVVPRLMLSPKEAAASLSMSEKGLWNITYPRGTLPAIKAGARTLYPIHLLRRWANQQWIKQQAKIAQTAESDGVV